MSTNELEAAAAGHAVLGAGGVAGSFDCRGLPSAATLMQQLACKIVIVLPPTSHNTAAGAPDGHALEAQPRSVHLQERIVPTNCEIFIWALFYTDKVYMCFNCVLSPGISLS